MDLGIKGKNAIVCAASKGLGKGCAMSLAREGVNLTINARTKDALEAAANEIRDATGVRVTTVAGDVTTDAAWVRALDANMLTPIFLIKATVDGMIARRFGRIVNITSVSVKSPIDILGLSNGARAGLTGFIAGLARKTVAHNVTINNLLPGPFDTDRLRSTIATVAKATGRSVEDVARERQAQNPAGRFGTAAEFGEVCAFVCSAQAGYMTGQNFVLDGGAYPGTL